MPRGELWLPEELKVLFKVVQDSCDLDILMSSRHANSVEWEPISREMVRYGFRRTWQQCRAKWKALRRAFHLENEYKILHGTHSDKRPASYGIMLKMWQKAGRPVFRDQHMLRTRSNHQHAASLSRERSSSYCSISHAAAQETYVGDIKTAILDHDVGSTDSSSIRCDEGALYSTTPEGFSYTHTQVSSLSHEDEEDVKPVIPETLRPDAEAPPEKCQELQLLEKLVMQQKEIITRLDFLNHNLVQMASLHYQHMVESPSEPVKTGSQDSVSFTPKFMTFPTPTSEGSSAYASYIQPPSSYISYSQSPSACMQPFQIPATFLSPPKPAATYLRSSQIPSTFYVPASKSTSMFLPNSPPVSAPSPRSVSPTSASPPAETRQSAAL
ncbi:uncharacterized protein O3C94_005013 [Discoglossus pictus]